MARYWWIALASAAVVAGSAMAATAASASPGLTHASSAPALTVSPGYPMITSKGRGARVAANSAMADATQSSNWSGYAMHHGKYRSVSSSWTEPKLTCGTTGKEYAAYWVGLDGYSSASVEQTGTDTDCSGPKARYYGWYEMFPAAPVTFAAAMKAGDHITASVTFSGTNTYTLVLKDLTRRWTRTIVRHRNGLARSSAEVITEAPSTVNRVLPLADFGAILYSSSAVNGTPLKKLAPTKIIMISVTPGKDKDLTSPVGSADRFHNTWLRSS
jgi:hypothetical protein